MSAKIILADMKTTTNTGSRVEWTTENYGQETTDRGVVLFVAEDRATVLRGSSMIRVPVDELRVIGSAAPCIGRGVDALKFIERNFPEAHPVREIARCLAWQVTGGNTKIGNAALAILRDGTALQVWKLVAKISATVENASAWGDVRRAADKVAS